MEINIANILTSVGIPGALILGEAWVIYWLFKRLSESQEQRVKESIDTVTKYEAAIDKVQDALDSIIVLLGRKTRVK